MLSSYLQTFQRTTIDAETRYPVSWRKIFESVGGSNIMRMGSPCSGFESWRCLKVVRTVLRRTVPILPRGLPETHHPPSPRQKAPESVPPSVFSALEYYSCGKGRTAMWSVRDTTAPQARLTAQESPILECFQHLKCYYRPTASLQLNNKGNTKYNITVT